MLDQLTSDETQQASNLITASCKQILQVYFADYDQVELLFITLLARGHILIEGVPGLAKTTLARSFAEVCGCTVRRIQFTPDLLPADLIGGTVYNPKDQAFNVYKGPIFTQLLLADELNRSPAKTQAATLEAMQERQVSIDGTSYVLPEPFMTIATQNPVEQAGVYPLPEAQIDRFAICIKVGYPTFDHEVAMLADHQGRQHTITAQLSPDMILKLQNLADRVFVHTDLQRYIVELVRKTRSLPEIKLGGSPRAALVLMQLARARALIKGRSFVSPDDISSLLHPTLKHRLVLTSESIYEGVKIDQLLSWILQAVPYRNMQSTR